MLKKMMWRLAPPYDAYVSHIVRLEAAFERIRVLSERAAGYEMGMRSSVRLSQGDSDVVERARRFRNQLGAASEAMSDDELESFLAELGGGHTADVERDRADIVSRMDHTTSGLQEYFATAGAALTILERRGYNSKRRDVARQLTANGVPARTLEEYHGALHELAATTGQAAEE